MGPGEKRRLFRVSIGKRISLRDMFFAWWPAILIVGAGFVIAYQFVQPAPPDRVVISAGPEDGAYYAYAERYREILARHDVWLDIQSSSGSVENYTLLNDQDAGVDIAFVQGGIGNAAEAPELVSLGGMYHEPLWVFYRHAEAIDRLAQVKANRIAIGPEGSGTRKLVTLLLIANGFAVPHGKLADLTGNAAAQALQQGRIDVAFFVASPQSEAVATLLRDRSVQLMSFRHSEAYVRHFPYLSTVVLPQGGIDLRHNIPPQDVHLLAATANLLVREDLHPALVGLFAAAAMEVHGGGGSFQRQGQFPSLQGTDFPISPEAERYYKSGPPFLQRYLPFWAAIFVDRMVVLLVPFFVLMIPLMRILPWLYNWRISSRIYRYYGQLRFLEDEVLRTTSGRKTAEYMQRLDEIESQVNRLPIPLAFNHQLYTLRQHIDLVRERVRKLADAIVEPAPRSEAS